MKLSDMPDTARWLIVHWEYMSRMPDHIVESEYEQFQLMDLPEDRPNGNLVAYRLDDEGNAEVKCEFSYEFCGITVCYPDEVHPPELLDDCDLREVAESSLKLCRD